MSINNLKFVTSLDYFYVHTFFKNMYFCSQKLRFEHYFVYCKMTMASLKQFIICSNLFSKLEKNCFKEAFSFCLQLEKKCSKSNFLEQKYIFLKNVPRFARKYFMTNHSKLYVSPPNFFTA